MNVAFIGLGAIGLPMALQIQRAGHSVVGVELSEAGRQAAQAQRLESSGDWRAALEAEVVVVMVATPAQLAALVDQFDQATPGQHWVIMSTVGPAAVREQGARLASRGIVVVDAPVTGGVARAQTGSLLIFASGTPEALDHVGPVLRAMGNVKPVGAQVGDGQAIKVVNQHLCSVHLVAAAEALNLARSLALDPAQVLALIEQGAGGSWMLSDRGPRMLEGTDTRVTSMVDIFVKDSGLVAEAARACNAQVPLLDIAHARFTQAADAGLGKRDDSRVIETWAPAGA
ncbi:MULTISPECIES: NAD(P)-dependent oxidoreductase [unclassified Pseudomonas]|uniref:NAD(P)-dependent oxidoreductase n=1 Tax=unclassified Pseudomonas TaxID=196821 RepID=UPI000BCF85F6|nr:MULTISPECIES: NAD(P)-dependent oxidoreductase [unclassified Pseudomonas]PVZ12280.1 3-hydroxyisobutyrate dehydrogenase [Pseudomonas sp. URIL14HWK12:I12]PVZ23568.1 3-hydroxyisobutyrate dehydrogenase [Pseudomonas sp. URIL14HWK12:I10]PVZ32898.1 3-hydroxyisobutyrate dehydrogenase [Pseudomonas sp. URIL14HWK12:I11]SNZ18766.1 3-hydroxyisobutyrate dehydrogenase [Pseudomonas sp. URIL14HWK12:I9]